MKRTLRTLATTALLLSGVAGAAEPASAPARLPTAAELKRMTARFAPVDIQVDVSKLPESERRALAKILQAARIMDPLFMRQAWAGNETLLLSLLQDTSALGKERLHAFLLNKGPWSRLDHNAPFVPGVPAKPLEGNFYPAGATQAEVETWVRSLPEAQQRQATGFFTTVRRGPDGNFISVPYSVEYQGELSQAARLLLEAAELTTQPTLRAFLTQRAASFLNNDYYPSEVAWMDLDASIEPTIGPYEVYEDEWFNYKAAFEAFITVRDDTETQKLAKFSGELQELENALPIEPKLRNPRLGALAPIRVVNSLFSSGDGNRGVQTAAYNLPNDERVAAEKGTKRVMLKNIQEAKFQRVLLPIAQVALTPKDRKDVSFDAFFTHILMHELMHGLGPHNITVEGKQTTVRQALQAASSPLEEAKADVSGLWALQRLVDKGVIGKEMERTMYTTFLASMFRSIRFGTSEAHGKGIAVLLNHFLDTGAVVVNKDGTFSVVKEKIRESVTALTKQIMELQAAGNRAAAESLLETRGVVRPEVKRVLDKLENVPVDIEPRYVTADTLAR
ncbi:MutT/NUDIX family protein [Cystobacter fuscus DSM 2262]|uniref:MutT/NUDIX family protein n=1 Tax=Cystobacter fuscus (strain ATCC 25194 / DSM 2262 / NBRC 100088 / M29) TaxID=1242864 RepID=S9R825_CYSF2|nr:DNA mismatch repair protein MutT [Cystobacter fuscus]EPX65228.1 MutT/NUDIX family protein [Cystobacter fuscus DSM 2262]